MVLPLYHVCYLLILLDLHAAEQPMVEQYDRDFNSGAQENKWIFEKSISRVQPAAGGGLRSKRFADSGRSDAIIFPDDEEPPKKELAQQQLENRLFVVPKSSTPPSCAGGDTFCESVNEYPSEHVKRLLNKEPVILKKLLQEDKIDNTLDNVEDRIDVSDENPICISEEHIIYPKIAKNAEGNWLFVINQDEYKQGIRVEKCVGEKKECRLLNALPIGYTSECKQKYIYRRLVALNTTGQGVVTDSFPLPSCCSCVLHQNRGIVLNRVAAAGIPLPLTIPKTTNKPRP